MADSFFQENLDTEAVISKLRMAAKRVTATAVDWTEFARKIPAANKGAFVALKNKQDGYVRAINGLPSALPAIDFTSYRARIAVGKNIESIFGNSPVVILEPIPSKCNPHNEPSSYYCICDCKEK